jgi:hypothetical protein
MAMEIQLWDEAAVSQLKVVADYLDYSFRDARNEPGTGSLTVPATAEYRAYFGRDLVVKHVLDGLTVYAWVIEQDVDGTVGETPTLKASGRGLLCWLEWSTVYPWHGLRQKSAEDRTFGFGSGDVYDVGFQSGIWSSAIQLDQSGPSNWPGTPFRTIWAGTSPNVPVPADQEAWFYRGFTLAQGTWVRVDATGDDEVQVWIDDEQIIDQDGTDTIDPGHTKSTTQRVRLAAGAHWIYAHGKQISSDAVADLGSGLTIGPAWVAVRVASITANDDPGSVILTTDSSWQATLTQPGWTPGLAFRLMLNEAITRGVDRLYWTDWTFGNTTDSNGEPWPHSVNQTWPVVSTDLLKLATDLAENGGDFWASPDKRLHAANNRGTDRTGTVFLFPTKHLTDFSVVRNHKVRTVAVVRSGVGFVEISDPAKNTYGRAETRIDASAIDSRARAGAYAASVLAPLAQPSVETDGDQTRIVPWTGATPYVDFNIADVVSVPSGLGGWRPATVMSITYRPTDGGDEWSLELDLAQTGARTVTKTPERRLLTIAQSGGAASAGGRIQSASK